MKDKALTIHSLSLILKDTYKYKFKKKKDKWYCKTNLDTEGEGSCKEEAEEQAREKIVAKWYLGLLDNKIENVYLDHMSCSPCKDKIDEPLVFILDKYGLTPLVITGLIILRCSYCGAVYLLEEHECFHYSILQTIQDLRSSFKDKASTHIYV